MKTGTICPVRWSHLQSLFETHLYIGGNYWNANGEYCPQRYLLCSHWCDSRSLSSPRPKGRWVIEKTDHSFWQCVSVPVEDDAATGSSTLCDDVLSLLFRLGETNSFSRPIKSLKAGPSDQADRPRFHHGSDPFLTRKVPSSWPLGPASMVSRRVCVADHVVPQMVFLWLFESFQLTFYFQFQTHTNRSIAFGAYAFWAGFDKS